MVPHPTAHLPRFAAVVFAVLLLAPTAWAAWVWLPQRHPAVCDVVAVLPGMDSILVERHLSDATRLITEMEQATDGAGEARERRRRAVIAVTDAGRALCHRHPVADQGWLRHLRHFAELRFAATDYATHRLPP